jgi:hypothetical protein
MNSVHNSAIRVAEHGLGIGSVPIKHHHKAPLLPGFGGGFVNHGRSSLGVMAIFAVIPTPTPAPPKLMAALAEHFKETHVVIDGGHGWLIAGRLTAKEVSDLLGITDGTSGRALIFEVASYFGRANPNMWRWIKLHWETGRSPDMAGQDSSGDAARPAPGTQPPANGGTRP